LFLVLFL